MAPPPSPLSLQRPALERGFGAVRLSILGLSVAVLVGVPLGWNLRGQPDAMGSLPPARADQPQGIKFSVKGPQVRPIAISSGRLADQAVTLPRAVPVRLEVPVIGLKAAIVPVGVEPHSRSMEVPADVDLVGWYRFSAAPGQPGSSVLIGHVDSWTQGQGAFFRLRELRVGSLILLRTDNGTVRRYRVQARRSYPKGHLPDLVFRQSGPSGLALITCGGAFDAAARQYADNVVVYGVPAGD
jgi:hypothetical protein